MTLELKITDWLSAYYGPDEVRETAGRIKITVEDLVATRVEDDWSKTVREEVYLSAYPLALWFASSWWRLRWEPATDAVANVAWRMAHEMAAAGQGFLWPRLMFAFDGERMDIVCRHSKRTPIEPIRYLEDFRQSITASEFERAVDAFINFVLERLDAVQVRNTDLQKIWAEVSEERQNSEASTYRRLEASLGFDPDEAPEETVECLRGLSSKAGYHAIAEIAPACSGVNPGAKLIALIEMAQSVGIQGRIQPLRQMPENSEFQYFTPWEKGWRLAQLARTEWGSTSGPVQDTDLSEILNIDASVFQNSQKAPHPLGLAVRNGDTDQLQFHFRKSHHHSRRFEGARFLADYLIAPRTDHWFPTTDTKTARQKVQRAFAAEFLCPISELKNFLNGDFSEDAIEGASQHFDVSTITINSHLNNNNIVVGTLGL